MRIAKFLIPLITSLLFLAPDVNSAIIYSEPISPNELTLKEFSKLNFRTYTQLTGQRLSLKQRLHFNLLKLSVKKEMRKNPGMTVGEYLNKKRDGEAGKSILAVILGIILLGFVMFLVLYRE